MGNKGGAWAEKSMTQSLDNKRSYSTMLWTCLTMGTRPPPLSPSPTRPRQASASLQHNVEDDVSDGGNAAGGPVSRVQERQLGGRAMQSASVVGSGGGRGGGCHTQKTTNIKRWGWDQSSEVRKLFEGDPARPGHPLHVEIENKLGDCVLKIRCSICRSLISYHNSSWTSRQLTFDPTTLRLPKTLQLPPPLLPSLRPMVRPSLSTNCQLHLQ